MSDLIGTLCANLSRPPEVCRLHEGIGGGAGPRTTAEIRSSGHAPACGSGRPLGQGTLSELARSCCFHRGRRSAHSRVAVEPAFEPGHARDRIRLRVRVPGVPEAGRPCLPPPGPRASGHQRPRSADANRSRRAPADRVHHWARRHSVFSTGDQGRCGRLPDQAVQGHRPDARDRCGAHSKPQAQAGAGRARRPASASFDPHAPRAGAAPTRRRRPSQQAGCGDARHQRRSRPRFIAVTSCRKCAPSRSPSWSGWPECSRYRSVTPGTAT